MSPINKSKLENLLRRLARSKEDQEAWEQIYVMLWPRVMSTMYRALGGLKDRAEDASQEVFARLVVYVDFRVLQATDDFLPYLHVMCQNVASDFVGALVDHTVSLEVAIEEGHEPRLNAPDPEQQIITQELALALHASLDREEQRLLDLMLNGTRDQEIADRLGWSYSKTGVRIHRLRRKIRKLLT